MSNILLKFKVTNGIFKIIADRALLDQENNYVIIIDEINRGNISKIFGELITLIEDDKRWGEAEQTSVKLASGDIFAVPNNLYILGTMNSADKSISLVDAALRRRFSFVEIVPNSKLLNIEFAKFLDQINSHLKIELHSKDLLIGHSYFINKEVKDFDKIINKNIIPLLYEYFFDDEAKIKKALDGINVVSYKDELDEKTYIFKLEDSNVGRIKCVKKRAADND